MAFLFSSYFTFSLNTKSNKNREEKAYGVNLQTQRIGYILEKNQIQFQQAREYRHITQKKLFLATYVMWICGFKKHERAFITSFSCILVVLLVCYKCLGKHAPDFSNEENKR